MKQKTFGPGVTPGVNVAIGIDQSYSGFGMSVLGQDGSHLTTVTAFKGRGVARLREIQRHVADVMYDYDGAVTDVAMEGYAYGSQMANMAGELGAAVKLALFEYDVYPLIVPPTTLKKYVTGKGNAGGKGQIMLNVYKKWGVEMLDDNAADAYGLARIAACLHTNLYERDVLDMLQDPKYREVQDVEL